MIDFTTLSREERALYNPALTGLVASRAVQGHQAQYGQPCPVIVAVLAAVMALQPSIRHALPRTTNSGLIRWLEENRAVKAAMTQNATALADVVRPGLLLALLKFPRDTGHVIVMPRGRADAAVWSRLG